MSATNEVFEVNTLLGAYFLTSAAAGTLGIIDGGEIVLNLDRSVRTGLLTLHTTDTAYGTNLVGNSALIMAGALNDNASIVGNNVNYVIGTGLCTDATTDTLGRIDVSDALLGIDDDSILGAYCNAVAVAETCKGTVTVTGIVKLCSCTGLDAVVNVLSLLGLASAVTAYVRNLGSNVTCCKTHDLAELLCNVSATGSTEAGVIGLALTKSLRISVTSGVAAGTAVCTGKAVTNCNNLLIFLNCEEGSSNGKNHCTDNCNYCKNN